MRILIVVIALAALGCNSNYIPRSRGRIAVVMRDGKPAYIRDGQTFDHGVLGGGLGDVVAGNRQAEDAAHEYRSRLGTGLVIGLGGPVGSSGALRGAAGKSLHETSPKKSA